MKKNVTINGTWRDSQIIVSAVFSPTCDIDVRELDFAVCKFNQNFCGLGGYARISENTARQAVGAFFLGGKVVFKATYINYWHNARSCHEADLVQEDSAILISDLEKMLSLVEGCSFRHGNYGQD